MLLPCIRWMQTISTPSSLLLSRVLLADQAKQRQREHTRSGRRENGKCGMTENTRHTIRLSPADSISMDRSIQPRVVIRLRSVPMKQLEQRLLLAAYEQRQPEPDGFTTIVRRGRWFKWLPAAIWYLIRANRRLTRIIRHGIRQTPISRMRSLSRRSFQSLLQHQLRHLCQRLHRR